MDTRKNSKAMRHNHLPTFSYFDFVVSPEKNLESPTNVEYRVKIGARSIEDAIKSYFHKVVPPWVYCHVVMIREYRVVSISGRTLYQYKHVKDYQGKKLARTIDRLSGL